jgi:hypothetical protein
VKLSIDGRTATNAPAGAYFPEMVMDLQLESGRANTIMGTMGTDDQKAANRDRLEAYLPRLQTSILQNVNSAAPTTITTGADAAPNITAQQRSQLTLEVQPGSMRDQNGNLVTSGQVGISTVPASLVREMLPPGLLQHTFDITVQAPGITNFTTPAPMTFPNLFGAAPGTQLNFLSFDHTTGKLVIEGTATVSADGQTVHTDPGTGITHPGWHGLTPQGSPTSPQGPIAPSPGTSPVVPFVSGVSDFLFTDDSIGTLAFYNNANPLAANPNSSIMRVKITVDPTIAQYYLDGLRNQTFDIRAGGGHLVNFQFLARDISKMKSDLLVGASYQVEIFKVNANGNGTSELLNKNTIFIYRYFDAMDGDSNDSVLEFANALGDARLGVQRTRVVDYLGDLSARPTITVANVSDDAFGVVDDSHKYQIIFDPLETAKNVEADIEMKTPAANPAHIYTAERFYAKGRTVQPTTVYLNRDQFLRVFRDLTFDVSPVSLTIRYDAHRLQATTPYTFRISIPSFPAGENTTGIIAYNAPASTVKMALEALPNIGPDGVDVTLTHQAIESEGGVVLAYEDTYRIQPKNGFDSIPTPQMEIVDVSPDVTTTFVRFSPPAVMTRDQIVELQQTTVETLYQEMKDRVTRNYSLQERSIKFEDGPPPTSEDLSLNWIIEPPPKSGTQIAQFPTVAFDPLLRVLFEITSRGANFNKSQTAFKIAQTLSTYLHYPGANVPGTVFVQRLFTPGAIGHANISIPELETLLGLVISHEIGHRMGLPHSTVKPIPIPGSAKNETQRIAVKSGATSFRLTYAGASTDSIPAGATAKVVETKLTTLQGLASSQLRVTGADGGPYTITFANSPFGTNDVPQITGVNVDFSTQIDGGKTMTYPDVVFVNGENGRDDIMRPTTSSDRTSFQQSISQIFLKMSLGDIWGSPEIESAQWLLAQYAKVGAIAPPRISPAPDSPDQSAGDGSEFLFNAPLFALVDSDGQPLESQPLDFHATAPNAPATKVLTLTNIGGQPGVVRGISVIQGVDRFAVTPIPVTTLRPGESLEVNVTFNSVLNLASSGRLVVDADAWVFGGDVELAGTGQLTNQPLIHVDFYNNLQGQQVGQATSFAGAQPPVITNQGSAPLTISQIRVASGQGFEEWYVPPLSAPITLAPGESTNIGFTFRPSKVGLRPGAFEVLSNDPNSPLLRIPVVATGVLTHDQYQSFDGVDLGNDYVAANANLSFQNNLPELRVKSDDKGNWSLFLPAQTGVHLATYDPVSGLIAHGGAFTSAGGIPTEANIGQFRPSVYPDTDGDGLPDDIEFAIGTNPNKIDTDGDGKNDFAELDNGLNPLDDRPAAVGVVSALSTGGSAKEIKLAADFRDPSRTLAFIADGDAGISIVDVTDFNRPITIAQLDVPGSINNLSLDIDRKLLAASSPIDGVHLIDISNPTKPVLLRTIAHQGTDPVGAVELYDGLVYVGVGSKVRAFDTASAELSTEVTIANPVISGMSRSGDRLYVTTHDASTGQNSLHALDLSGVVLAELGSILLPSTPGIGDPFVSDNLAWIPARDRLVTVGVANPQALQIIAGSQPLQQAVVNDIDLNGSGLGLAPGISAGNGALFVMQTSNPQNASQVFTRFNIPRNVDSAQTGLATALGGGFAYVADGDAGLQVVNFIQFDVGSTPPTISVDPISGDVDTGTSGLQLFEATTISIPAHVTDDVQVRSVELLLNGKVVRTAVSYPYDLTITLPKIADAGNQAVLQVRATDTGGNVSLSQPIVIDLRADLVAPTVSILDPPNGSTQPLSRRTVSITFSEPVDRATVVPASFVLHGPSGDISPVSIDLRQHDTRVEILYPPLAAGSYTVTIHGPAIKDRSGNALSASDVTSTFSVAAATRQPTIRWVNNAGGAWTDLNNWRDAATNLPRVPTAADDVLMDVPTDAIVILSAGNVTVNSIISNEQFLITGGRLNVTDTIKVNNTFLLKGTASAVATLSGTVLRGDGGQGITVQGEGRLDGATVQTDILVNNVVSKLRLANGLALGGTLTYAIANSSLVIEGSQTISSGTIVTTGATPAAQLMRVEALGTSTLTLGQDVAFQAQVLFTNGINPNDKLTVINRGTISTPSSTTFSFGAFTRTESFTNFGLMTHQSRGVVSIEDKTFLNAGSGRIIVSEPQQINVIQGAFGKDTTTSFTNAGTIEVHNSAAQIMSRTGVGQTWSNTGNIIVDKSDVSVYGTFTSDSLTNVQNTGIITIQGLMDNTGRSFTFTTGLGLVFTGTGGTVKGGTLNMAGPGARLEFIEGTLDGVVINGDVALGPPITTYRGIGAGSFPGAIFVQNGLTLNGTLTVYYGPSAETLTFTGGPQAVSGNGTIQFLNYPNGGGRNLTNGLRTANGAGVVNIAPTITLRGGTSGLGRPNGLEGNFVSSANVVIDANQGILLGGNSQKSNPSLGGPFVQRASASVGSTRKLVMIGPFVNEGSIAVTGTGLAQANLDDSWKNSGTINLAGGGTLYFSHLFGSDQNTIKTADLGEILDSGGFVQFDGDVLLDNSNSTLEIDGTANWTFLDATLVGGTVNVASTAKFGANLNRTAVLKDLVVNGNTRLPQFATLDLVGDIDFNGQVLATDTATLQFGHSSRYTGDPVSIHSANFDLSFVTIRGASLTQVPGVTLDSDVILRGRGMQATFTQPLTNKGQIVADRTNPFASGEAFNFTAAPITNLGSLSAVNKSVLRIANLAAPNTGTVAAEAGASVEFAGDFAQASGGATRVDIGGTASTAYGLVAITGAATLAGTLEVQFVAGFAPVVGNRFQVLNYGSHTGQFDSVHVTGLPAGLVVTPEYNATNLTLVVNAAPSGLIALGLSERGAESEFNPLPGARAWQRGAQDTTPLAISNAKSLADGCAAVSASLAELSASSPLCANQALQLVGNPTPAENQPNAVKDAVFEQLGDELVLDWC